MSTTPPAWYPPDAEEGEPARWYTLIFTRSDGGTTTTVLASTFATHEEEKAAYAQIAPGLVEVGQHWEVISRVKHEQSVGRIGGKYFRDAWTYQPGSDTQTVSGLALNMPFARAIFRHHIREVRDPLLNALDVEFYKAQEAGTDTTEIAAKKQVLRDLPQDPAIEAATTPQELMDAWPTALLGERSTEGRGLPASGYYESPGTY